ncbi:MAG: hypothetical protein AAGI34_19475, partial [Pseudomonadota bacterium]
ETAADKFGEDSLNQLVGNIYDQTAKEAVEGSIELYFRDFDRALVNTASGTGQLSSRQLRDFNDELREYRTLLNEISGKLTAANSAIDGAKTIYNVGIQDPANDDFGNEMINGVVAVARLPRDAADTLKAGIDIVKAVPGAGSFLAAPLEKLQEVLDLIAKVADAQIDQMKDNLLAVYLQRGDSLVINGDVSLSPAEFAGKKLLVGTTRFALSNGERERPCSEDDGGRDDRLAENATFHGRGFDSGTIYTTSEDGLTIQSRGVTVTLNGWSQYDNGITLRIDDARNGGNGCGNPDGNGGNGGGGRPGALGDNDDQASPIVLDLDGDGLELTEVSDTSLYFDIDADGVAERTGWVTGGDGLLAFDADGDGAITSATELFGVGETYDGIRTELAPDFDFAGYDICFESAFDKLAAFDSNGDGAIDARDARFDALRVWVDNGNGESAPEELLTLTDAGVASISLAAVREMVVLGDNLLTDRSTFTTTECDVREASDIWFGFDQLTTRAVEAAVPEAIAGLPNTQGGGTLADLHRAMAEDGVLAALVADLAALPVGALTEVSPRIEAILSRWAGVDQDVATDLSRGEFASARHVAVTEATTDTPFSQVGQPNPRPNAGATIEDEWDVLHRNLTAELMAQTEAGQALFPEIGFEGGPLLTLAPGAEASAMIARLTAASPADPLDKIAHWHAGLRILDGISSGFADLDKASYRAAAEAALQADGLDLTYLSLLTARIGGDEADGLLSQSVNGNLYSL